MRGVRFGLRRTGCGVHDRAGFSLLMKQILISKLMNFSRFTLQQRLVVLLAGVIVIVCSPPCVHAQKSPPLKLTKAIPLPGVEGRFDHFAIDEKGRRLFANALGNNTVEVVDVKNGKRLRSITDLHKPTGVLYLPESNRLYVANGEDGTLKIFDGTTLHLLQSIGSLDDADNVHYDGKAKLIYVGCGGGALAVIDPATLKILGRIKLNAHPESFQLEQNGNRIFVNVPDARQIAMIDREKREVAQTWPMEKFKANFPMALDESNHRLLVGFRSPARLIVFDTKNGKNKNSGDTEISGDTDDLFYDAKRKRIYISCGEGFIDVVEQFSPDNYKRIAKIPSSAGARTSFFSAGLDEFYLAVPHHGNQQAEIRSYAPE
jgi:hypothetical protein